jgi:saccharopine dehydrogenase-like NADP-dependent oxidoreductase
MRALRETGFFSKTAVEAAGQWIRPLDLTAAILFPKWTFEEGEADLTVLRVMVEGRRGSSRERYSWDLLDYFDPQFGLRSMSRTTAFPAAIVASMVASGGFARPGVHPPETLGATPGLLDVILRELRARGVECGGSVMAEEAEPDLVAGHGR